MKSILNMQSWPLRLKIVLLLFVSSVLPLALLSGIEYQHAREQVLKNTAALLTARGDEIEGRLDAFTDLYRSGSERFAGIPAVIQYLQSPPELQGEATPAMHSILALWPNTDANIRGVALLDATGTVMLGTESPLIGRNLMQYGYIRDALKGTQTISDLHISEPETGSVPSIAFLTPIYGEQRQVLGAIAVWVKASALWNIVAEGNEQAGEKSFSVLFDRFGIRIAHSYSANIVFHPGGQLDHATVNAMVAERRFGDKTRQLLEAPRLFPEQFRLARLADSPSREVFRGFAPVNQQWNIGVPRRLKNVPWTLFYMIPESSLNTPIVRLTARVVALTAGVMFLAILAGTLVARGIVGSVKLISEGADTLSESATALAASVAQITSSTSETATAVSQTTSTVDEVKQTAKISAEKARYVSDSAQKTAQISLQGQKSMQESAEAMQRIKEQMESIAESITLLSEQSQAIGEIVASVNDLTEQSNLLAVNTAIEAAKAGEQGKGFTVVAQEIKSLAEQSKQATTQVRMILSDIQKATSKAVTATEQGSTAVTIGARLSGEAGESIRMLAESIDEAALAATQIAVSAQQQLVGMDQVALAMLNIEQASAQNAASIKQTADAAKSLQALGLRFKRLAETYQG